MYMSGLMQKAGQKVLHSSRDVYGLVDHSPALKLYGDLKQMISLILMLALL